MRGGLPLCGLLWRVGWRGRGWDASWALRPQASRRCSSLHTPSAWVPASVHLLSACAPAPSTALQAAGSRSWGGRSPSPAWTLKPAAHGVPRPRGGCSRNWPRLRPGQAQRLLWEWCPSFIHSFIHSLDRFVSVPRRKRQTQALGSWSLKARLWIPPVKPDLS